MSLREQVMVELSRVFGTPERITRKIVSWSLAEHFGVAMQLDIPTDGSRALVWIPYPESAESVPEIATEYPGEAGRHSNTYPTPGLSRGLPVIRLNVTSGDEIEQVISYIQAAQTSSPLPAIARSHEAGELHRVDPSQMPEPEPVAPRRRAIPRAVQREVWQRDGGRCVECGTDARLCFDHIVPFSLGGGETVRNIQLLCERCNLAKSNRL